MQEKSSAIHTKNSQKYLNNARKIICISFDTGGGNKVA